VILEEGRVTQAGTPEEIRSAPRTRYAADVAGTNFFRGRLDALGDGAARLLVDGGEIVVATGAAAAGEVVATLPPTDVSLHLDRPSGSARNVLRGRVTSIWVDGGRARLRIASRPPLVADVTAGSIERLGLREGSDVWAAFKAVEVRVEPDAPG
jgi:molybdate transport system ATP-binding protein